VLGFDEAAGGDEVFRDLLLERIVEPTSKADSLQGARGNRPGVPGPCHVFGIGGCVLGY
jgi:hypothetical protein